MSAEPFIDTNIWVHAHTEESQDIRGPLARTLVEDGRRFVILKLRYRFSYWDSLVIATALNAGYSALYSEDLQDRQQIEGVLGIVNPLVA